MATAERVPFAGSWSDTDPRKFLNYGRCSSNSRLAFRTERIRWRAADGRAKTIAASQARLARIVGRDVDDADPSAWIALAQYFVEAQIRAITDGGMLVLSRGELPASAPIVVAGIGAGLLREVARRLSRDYIDFDALIDASPDVRTMVSSVAPAASIAILGSWAEDFSDHQMEA